MEWMNGQPDFQRPRSNIQPPAFRSWCHARPEALTVSLLRPGAVAAALTSCRRCSSLAELDAFPFPPCSAFLVVRRF